MQTAETKPWQTCAKCGVAITNRARLKCYSCDPHNKEGWVAETQDKMGKAFYVDVVRLEAENLKLKRALAEYGGDHAVCEALK